MTSDTAPNTAEAYPPPHGDALRRAIRLSYVAAVLWACGNTVSSGLLLVFLAQELGGGGKQIAYLQIAPALFGLLRLFTPLVIGRIGGTKRACLGLSVAAYALLFAVPTIVELGRQGGRRSEALSILIALFCIHQLLEQIATIALWTWLTDLVPRRLRGRYFSRRNMLQLAIVIATLLASGWYIDRAVAAERDAAAAGLIVSYAPAHYATLIAGGAVLLMASLAPLAMIPAARTVSRADTVVPETSESARGLFHFRTLLASLFEPAARRLLLYGCWFSFFNGLFQIAQNIYPKGVLKLSLRDVNMMQTAMRLGQIGVSAWAGPTSDRCGNRPVVVLCQLLVGAAPLFYFLASPNSFYWLYGAWILWSAYAGINICVPNLIFRLAPPAERSAHYAAYQAVTSLFLVAGTLIGGYVFDGLGQPFTLEVLGLQFRFDGFAVDKFALFFLAALVMRSLGAAIIASVPEPGAKRVVELFARR